MNGAELAVWPDCGRLANGALFIQPEWLRETDPNVRVCGHEDYHPECPCCGPYGLRPADFWAINRLRRRAGLRYLSDGRRIYSGCGFCGQRVNRHPELAEPGEGPIGYSSRVGPYHVDCLTR